MRQLPLWYLCRSNTIFRLVSLCNSFMEIQLGMCPTALYRLQHFAQCWNETTDKDNYVLSLPLEMGETCKHTIFKTLHSHPYWNRHIEWQWRQPMREVSLTCCPHLPPFHHHQPVAVLTFHFLTSAVVFKVLVCVCVCTVVTCICV